MKRTLAALLMAGLCVLGTGCTNCGWVYEPFGPGTLCTGEPCGSGCGGGCASSACSACEAPACTSCAAPACTSCAAPTPAACACNTACEPCGTCGNACECTCASPCGPLTWLFQVLNGGYCGDGCGEMWWGDFHGAPPTCCEPCNRMGEWTGQPGGAPMSTSGCSSCGGGSTIDYTYQNQPRVLAGSTARVTPVRQAAKPISTTQR